jgi:hypothetical protein
MEGVSKTTKNVRTAGLFAEIRKRKCKFMFILFMTLKCHTIIIIIIIIIIMLTFSAYVAGFEIQDTSRSKAS